VRCAKHGCAWPADEDCGWRWGGEEDLSGRETWCTVVRGRLDVVKRRLEAGLSGEGEAER
jgi:hypothetical protein